MTGFICRLWNDIRDLHDYTKNNSWKQKTSKGRERLKMIHKRRMDNPQFSLKLQKAWMHLCGYQCRKKLKLYKNKTWKLVLLPSERKVFGNRGIYKIKWNSNDQVERYRARFVVNGYAQKDDIDFNEIFSPMVWLTTIKIVLSMYATFDLHLEQLEVNTIFLHGELEEEIYILLLKGFAESGKENLISYKPLCGLKQAPRYSYKRFDYFQN